ncbi:hypothetical protein SLE2022_234460 [Rubroshorea leprosula]
MTLNILSDIFGSVLRSTFIKDDISPIWSGNDGVEFLPITISTKTFSLDDINQIKSSLNVTINDVITRIIFFRSWLYMEKMCKGSTKTDSTALVMLNTRMFQCYSSVEEMLKLDSPIL